MFACTTVNSHGASAIACPCHSAAFLSLNHVLTQKFSRRAHLVAPSGIFGASARGTAKARAKVPDGPKKPIAFTNINVFDGKSEVLRKGLTVIVEGNRIKSVDASRSEPGEGFDVIEGGGRTLMPGLIDNHWHAMMAAVGLSELLSSDIGYLTLCAADQAEKTLMRGFTSVRDMAGPTFGLKRAIDDCLVAGPRIWPSGAMISQTSGHGDYRMLSEIPAQRNAPLSRVEILGGGVIADGVPEVLKRVREQLMLGASQIKLAAGGGVTSNHDPLDVCQFTEGGM